MAFEFNFEYTKFFNKYVRTLTAYSGHLGEATVVGNTRLVSTFNHGTLHDSTTR